MYEVCSSFNQRKRFVGSSRSSHVAKECSILSHICSAWRSSYYKFSLVTESEFTFWEQEITRNLQYNNRILDFHLQKCVAILPKIALGQDKRDQHDSFPSQQRKGCQNAFAHVRVVLSKFFETTKQPMKKSNSFLVFLSLKLFKSLYTS